MVADARQTLGVAVFVKTPGLSPIKTRLALGVGAARAAAFYELAVASVRSVVASSPVQGFWAVAESSPEALRRWQDFATVAQGEGDLGARLATVYDTVLLRGLSPVLIGADAPQITADHFVEVEQALRDYDFVLGPARDGGFYLLAGRVPVPRSVFEGVRYSAADTGEQIAARPRLLGRLIMLSPLTDVDEAGDLAVAAAELGAINNRTVEQTALLTWIRA